MTDLLASLSHALADRTAAAAPCLVSLHPGGRTQRTGFALREGLVVTSEQALPEAAQVPVHLPGGAATMATLAGRDPATNLAVLRLDLPALPGATAAPRAGALALALGAEQGAPTAALGLVRRVGPAWDSMAGGRIDALVLLDLRLSHAAEGGPVLDGAGGLLGMACFGPRRRPMVIPAATLARALDAVLDGSAGAARGWLGLGLHPVGLPAPIVAAAGREVGLMVVSLAPHGPAERAGILPGDILLEVDGVPAPDRGALARCLGAARIGQPLPLRLLRGGVPIEIPATIVARGAP